MLKLLYNTADVLIMPNLPGYTEGFGLVSLEAASCGLPVIASELGGIKDAIKDGENGFLVEPGNPQAFIDKIHDLLSNEKERLAFGERARNYTVENYGWDKTVKKYMDELTLSGRGHGRD
jgi:glycosyltransferase involved in cell wall biosynthesis